MVFFEERNEIVENYANALYQASADAKLELGDVIKDIEFFCSFLENEDLGAIKQLLEYPLIKDEQKINAIHNIFDGNIDTLVIEFLVQLTKEHRMSFLDLIVSELKMLYRRDNNIVKVQAVFGLTPSQEQVTTIIESLKTKLSCSEIEFEYEVDSTLIGGVQLFYNGQYIDNTLAQKIKRYAKQIRA